MDALLNVTPASLATWVGLIDDGQGDKPEEARSRMLKMQLGILQRKPRYLQEPIHCELAATYLPDLVQKYRATDGVIHSAMTLLNVLTYTPYFVRFARTPAGQGLAALQTKRTAAAVDEIDQMSADEVGEIGQFLATLLLLQGIGEVDPADKAILIPKLRKWERVFSGRLASDVSERCIALLLDDPNMRPMMQSVKTMIESKLQKCGGPSCQRALQGNGSQLMQCARCKSAVYCGVQHQKAAWPSHKATCFTPKF
ncbi:hypothetical protein BD779DRAFT_153864 [Infundibulicybe gibba]|nr:hypothetical protein BD779DRAFT_153864 [Infundibulicybe gibba]